MTLVVWVGHVLTGALLCNSLRLGILQALWKVIRWQGF